MALLRFTNEDSWVLRLLANHIGYISFALPIAALFLISKRASYTSWPYPIRTLTALLIRLFISDTLYSTLPDIENKEPVPNALTPQPPKPPNYTHRHVLKLVFSFFGLQISYLLWGLLQERIMTQKYGEERFTNSQFLVFVNRSLATLVAYVLLKLFYPIKKISATSPPLYQYGIVSYANCMSTWFQYESLMYISFPVQVIAKSVKTIPVMIIGKFVSNKTYPMRQYLLMLLLACGIALFLSGYHENSSQNSPKKLKQNITTLSGVVLLICYLAFDAFTSNYQKLLFDRYPISFLNMMFFVNLISTVITVTSLLFNGTLWDCLSFLQRHQSFALHVLATSLSSSIGQLFIFSTIEEFGPVVFTVIMTVRQAFSIILSCIFYDHHLSWYSMIGLQIAFAAIFAQAYLQFKKSKQSNSSNV